ncbi:MAG: 16S rRNA (cytidine(1402)-2'-O)-methyltransferase [Chitinispirillales bacterium]|jgi:16S rRNA (cytidine1402-2'-O)-methyltransferase|nr:16S rRNA (cytidine(1402)-2'-O)-methyltransferase [Chitinispirillales bacterium]
MLYIVPTPIGNLEDITVRAKKILCEVDLIIAEDTRNSGILLKRIGSEVKMKSYHDHNETKVSESFIEIMKSGKSVALITDAGTPGIADPAFYIVREAIKNDIKTVSLPGPTAFTTALVASGLPSERFIFENFLPPKSAKRIKIFQNFIGEKRTVIFYESPHRILKVLDEMADVFGEIPVVVARELTKIFEEFIRGTPKEVLQSFKNRSPKGEFVVLFNAGGIAADELGFNKTDKK